MHLTGLRVELGQRVQVLLGEQVDLRMGARRAALLASQREWRSGPIAFCHLGLGLLVALTVMALLQTVEFLSVLLPEALNHVRNVGILSLQSLKEL